MRCTLSVCARRIQNESRRLFLKPFSLKRVFLERIFLKRLFCNDYLNPGPLLRIELLLTRMRLFFSAAFAEVSSSLLSVGHIAGDVDHAESLASRLLQPCCLNACQVDFDRMRESSQLPHDISRGLVLGLRTIRRWPIVPRARVTIAEPHAMVDIIRDYVSDNSAVGCNMENYHDVQSLALPTLSSPFTSTWAWLASS